jgi:predicted enzyme related to lactoylglutathione lyase
MNGTFMNASKCVSFNPMGSEQPMSRVYYFEIPVDDFNRAIEFYETVFGWKITKQERPSGPYYSVKTGDPDEPGINGSLFKKEEGWSTVSNVIRVQNIDSVIESLKKLGGEIIFPKTVINGVGYLAYFKDPEGNTFGMMQEDPKAQSESGM